MVKNDNQRRLKNREVENMFDDSPTLIISKRSCEKVWLNRFWSPAR